MGLTDRQQPPRRRFRQELLTNLLNPKAGAFFVAVLPQFIGVGESVLATTLFFATWTPASRWPPCRSTRRLRSAPGRYCAARLRVAPSIASAVRF